MPTWHNVPVIDTDYFVWNCNQCLRSIDHVSFNRPFSHNRMRTVLAGIVREEVVIGDHGQPVMIGRGKWRRPKTRIVTEDAEGRVVDLHAMRTTLGTKLARQGVKPQVAREIMRHSDYKTTLKHYTVLGLSDTAGAINELPDIGRTEPIKATGTLSASADPQQIQQQIHQQLVHETMRNGASQCENDKVSVPQDRTSDDTVNTASCETKRNDATTCDHDAGVTRLAECQPLKLLFCQETNSAPISVK